MKKTYVENITAGKKVKDSFMIMKKVYREGINTIAYIGDRTGDIKSSIEDKLDLLNKGDVIDIKGVFTNILEIKEFTKIEDYVLQDYLPAVERPIEEIMKELEEMSKEEFKTKECKALNDYFFNNEEFLQEFKKGIGGVSQHHNYIGGLAEHTLNVMYLSKIMCYRYNCRNKELAIIAAKLHDIGKIQEYNVNGPFSFSLKGEMEGHIIIGISMIEEAFNSNKDLYSDDFKQRIKGCIVQHHGKLEYGSPKKPNTQEAFIVHFADYIDANFNKIEIVKRGVAENTWTEYDRRIDGKIYV